MAAGLGFKTFTTGEVLTAADTNGYLMQGVLVFASSAARASAITSPQEGQYSYLKDTNSTEYYDGAAWIAAPIGDITGVTAGTGISGGGTSGTVTITNSMATEITAKGDLIAGTGSATFDNLPVGTNGQTLVADSTASTGLKWATPASSAQNFTLLSTSTLSVGGVSTFTVSSLSGYNQLLIYIDGASTTGANPVYTLRLNADSTSKYVSNGMQFSGSTVYSNFIQNLNNSSEFKFCTGSNAAGGYTMGQILITGANSSGAKMIQATNATDATSGYPSIFQGIYTGTSVISSFSIITTVGTFDSGTMSIWGAA